MASSMQPTKDSEEVAEQNGGVKLKRQLGLIHGVGISFGLVVGSGIYITPSGVISHAGSAGLCILLWSVAGILETIGSLCMAELGTTFPKSGERYAYLTVMFGPFAAYAYLWTYLLGVRCPSNVLKSIILSRSILTLILPDCTELPGGAVTLIALLIQGTTDQAHEAETTVVHLVPPDDDPEAKPLLMIPVYASLMLLIIICNGVFVVIVVLNRKSQAATSIFLVSLAIADLLIGLLVIPATIYGLARDVHSGLVQCQILPYSQLLSVAASIGSLLFICIDRYRVVVLHKPQWKSAQSCRIVVWIWVSSTIYSIRHFVQQAIRRLHTDDEEVEEVCGMFIEDDQSDLWFRLLDFVVLFCVPMGAMTAMYWRVVLQLWAPNTAASQNTLARKKRVVVMCIAILVSFFVCWLPWHLTDIIADIIELAETGEEEEDEEAISVQVAVFTAALPLINSFTSPIFYAAFNAFYRQKLLDLIPCRKNIVAPDNTIQPASSLKSTLPSSSQHQKPKQTGD